MTDNAFPISVFHDSVDLQCMHYFVKFKLKRSIYCVRLIAPSR